MKLTARLAINQIRVNRNRSLMTLLGIVLSSAMLTAVCGFVSSAKQTVYTALGMDAQAPLHFTLIILGAILGSIIVTASIIVVSNAFRISAGERTRQFGILKSVGATKRQIAETVMYEGMFLSIIGIPLGIVAGLLIDLVGITVMSNLLHSLVSGGTMNVDNEAVLDVPFVAPPIMFVVTVITSFGTVLISAWLPARKAAKIPAIDAIRNAGEVKLKGKNVHSSKLVQKIFGFEGALAEKSLNRSRRSFRATVLSLTISFMLLITAGSFGTQMKRSVELMYPNINASVEVSWQSDMEMNYGDDGKIANINYIAMDSATVKTITEKLINYKETEIFGIGRLWQYNTVLPDGTQTKATLLSVDSKHYEQLCETAGVPIGSSILINLRREVIEGKRKEYVPYDFSMINGKSLTFTFAGHESIDVVITGELTWQDIPSELAYYIYGSELAVIVSDCETAGCVWFANTQDVAGFIEYAKQALSEFAPQSTDEIFVNADALDIASIVKQLRDLTNTIMFFVYGFVIMLTLIAITSVISTINTNIRSRAREFAMLESVGMTKSGVKKMLNLESILCSIRSLMFGIPLGIAGAYSLYWGMGFSIGLTFVFPWSSIAVCVVGVFVVTWVTMRYSANRFKNSNIIETIRGE